MIAASRRSPLLLALLAGALMALSTAPTSWVVLLFGAMIFWVEAARSSEGASITRGAKLGLAVGFAFHGIAFHWVVPLFTRHVPIPLPVGIVLAIIFWLGHSLPFVVAGALAELLHEARVPRSLALAMSLPLAFDAVWSLFPFRPAEFLVPWIRYAQLADLSGPGPLDMLIVLAGAGTLEGFRSKRWGLVVLGLASCFGPYVYGAQRIAELDRARSAAPIARVGVVQPNIPQQLKQDDRLAIPQLDTLRRLTGEVEARGVDFTVWPETAYPAIFSRVRLRDPVGRRGIHFGGHVRGPVLFGALTGDGMCTNRNSALVMDSRGTVDSIADKVLLLPFSEEIPFYRYLPLIHRVAPCPGFVRGEGPTALSIGGSRVGILNCYEDLFPWYARDLANLHPDFLVNLTNDAWFFDTREPHLHHMAAQMRAIETRRDLVRVVNTGLTGHIDALGRRVDELPVWTEGTRVFRVRRMPDGTSRYLREGDVFTPALLASFAGILALSMGFRLARAAREA